MKEFKPKTGGHPDILEDYQFLQESFVEVIQELLESDLVGVNDPFVLRGVVITSPALNAQVTAGSIYYEGKVYLVDAATLLGSGTLYFEKVTTHPAYNPLEYADLQMKSPHEIIKLRPTYVNPLANGFLASALNRYVNPYNSFIGQICSFFPNITPDPLYWLPCIYTTNDIIDTDPLYEDFKTDKGKYNFDLFLSNVGDLGPNDVAGVCGGFGKDEHPPVPLNTNLDIVIVSDSNGVLIAPPFQFKYITLNQPGMTPNENVTGYFLCDNSGLPIKLILGAPITFEARIELYVPEIPDTYYAKHYIRVN